MQVDINPSQMLASPPNYVTGIEHTKANLPKMEQNGVDAVFFSIHVGKRQDFRDSCYAAVMAADIEKLDAVHTLAAKMAPGQIAIAYTAAKARASQRQVGPPRATPAAHRMTRFSLSTGRSWRQSTPSSRPRLARPPGTSWTTLITRCSSSASTTSASRPTSTAAARAGMRIDTLAGVNVGVNRCGAEPGALALALAQTVAASPHLRCAELQAYHGSAQHMRTVADRRAAIERVIERIRSTRELIVASGVPCATVTGAGTGGFPIELASGTFDELQPGSYIFMAMDYRRNAFDAAWPPFEQSLFVWSAVMSKPTDTRAVVDAGLKSLAFDSGMPGAWQMPGVAYVKESDEHGVLAISPDAQGPAPGDKLLLVPGHYDRTVDLHDWFVCVRRGGGEALWPVGARGATR